MDADQGKSYWSFGTGTCLDLSTLLIIATVLIHYYVFPFGALGQSEHRARRHFQWTMYRLYLLSRLIPLPLRFITFNTNRDIGKTPRLTLM